MRIRTLSVRVGYHMHAEHSAVWYSEEECAGGCGCAATHRHALTPPCDRVRGREMYPERVGALLVQLEKVVPKPVSVMTAGMPIGVVDMSV